jgi:thiamine biosynthesis protein ThiS
MVEIRLNGATRAVPEGATLAGLLSELDLDPRWVIAELNGEPLDRERFAEVTLSPGDQLELVRPVAGG